jgi:NADP-dependent 3-hydroxy acid dehydrogenase YdfG
MVGYPAESVAGKYVLITGGTTGIGRATALLLASHGAHVMIFGRNPQHLKDAISDIEATGGDVFGLAADLTRLEDIQRVFQEADRKWGRLDVLVNNASLPANSVVKDTDYAEWDYVLRTNVLGYIACTREAVDRMRKTGGGHIVNIGSLSAYVREKGASLYVATKSAVEGLSAALGKELMDDDIKVSLIEPGAVGSDMVELSAEEQAKMQAEGRMLKAEDIAGCVYYCLTQPPRCTVMEVRIRPSKQEI